MSILEQLTETDKIKIEDYITYQLSRPRVSIEQLLTPWANAKDEYLAKLFNNQLIIKEQVTQIEDMESIRSKIYSQIGCSTQFDPIFEKLNSKIVEYNDLNHWDIQFLYSTNSFADNKYEIDFNGKAYIDIKLPNGKTYTVQNGAKPLKVLKKLLIAFDLFSEEWFTNLVNTHSMCLNAKKLEGELCLSIHPLDYITMSDNNCDWDSCMNWTDEGEYRQGTVEMMNSPCVVVGYLTSSKPYYFKYNEEVERYKWNNKKWRCLFVVDKDFIVSIRDYPYDNPQLLQLCMEKLAKLSGFTDYLYEPKYVANKDNVLTKNGYIFNPKFRTSVMYNDLNCRYDYQVIINSSFNCNLNKTLYNYSGLSECMECGETFEYEEWTGKQGSEQDLVCMKCNPKTCCDHCDYIIYDDGDKYYFGENVYCNCCINKVATYDNVTYDYIENEEAVTIYLNDTFDKTENVKNKLINNTYFISNFTTHKDNLDEDWFLNQLFKVPPTKIDENIYLVNADECTLSGYRKFGIYSSSIRRFLQSYLKCEIPDSMVFDDEPQTPLEELF